jgi:uncharacterized protein YutE (UPF0331/DUF86 family)
MPQGAMREADLLDAVVSRYEGEGYEVYLQPSSSLLPPFMKGYRPDAIAKKSGKNVAIEIKRAGSPRAPIRRLQRMFLAHPDWEFTVLYFTPRSTAAVVGVATNQAIEQSIDQIKELKNTGHRSAALLIGWSALEAVARSLLPEQLDRPQPPDSLIEAIAGQGLLTPSEANVLRRLASTRNAAAHGQLDISPTPRQIDQLVGVLHTLSDLLAKDAA